MCLTANKFELQEENINLFKPQGKALIRNGMGNHRKRERGRWTERERKREKEEWRMQYFLKKDDKSLIDVEHVETDNKLKWDCICLSIVDLFAEVTRFVRFGVYRVL